MGRVAPERGGAGMPGRIRALLPGSHERPWFDLIR